MSAAAPSAIIGGRSRSRGSLGRLGVRELRRALGHQGVSLADEGAILDSARDDHLALVLEGIGNCPGVANGNRARWIVAVGDPELELIALMVDRAGYDHAGQLVVVARRRGEQIRGLLGLG